MGILLMMRYLLTVILFLSLVPVSEGAWTDILQKESPKTPLAEKPRVEQNVCIDCHDSELMKDDYKAIPGEWRKSWHYQNGVSCQDCHGGDPKDAGKSMTKESGFIGAPKPKAVPEFCGKCHIGILENYRGSAHGKALKATGQAPNCVVCHGSHNVQKANLNIINEELCGLCHTYDRAKTIKASLQLTEQKINEIDKELKTLKAGLINTGDEEKTLFGTQAEYRTLFHTQDVNLVTDRTAEFTKKLAVLQQQVQKGFEELKFRQDFAILIILIFVGLGVCIFLLGWKSS
jgi:nitrate/TMAO reductase-like tetraheme cytochrome c subunit